MNTQKKYLPIILIFAASIIILVSLAIPTQTPPIEPIWKVEFDNDGIGAPIIADVDDDGDKEIIVITSTSSSSFGGISEYYLRVIDHNGNKYFSDLPLLDAKYVKSEVTVDDIDANGTLEIIISAIGQKNELIIYIVGSDGTLNNKIIFNDKKYIGVSRSILWDIDFDGSLDIIVSAVFKYDESEDEYGNSVYSEGSVLYAINDKGDIIYSYTQEDRKISELAIIQKLKGFNVKIDGEDFPALEPGISFTTYNSQEGAKLWAIAVGDININKLPDPTDEFGLVNGYPQDCYSEYPKIMGTPYEKIVMGDIDKEGHPTIRIFSHIDGSITHKEVKWVNKPEEANCIGISMCAEDQIIAEFTEDLALLRMEVNLINTPSEDSSIPYSPPGTCSTLAGEVIKVGLMLDGKLKTFYLESNINYGLDKNDKLSFKLDDTKQEQLNGIAVADLDGNGTIEVIFTVLYVESVYVPNDKDIVKIYVYNPEGVYSDANPRRVAHPMRHWIQKPTYTPGIEIIESPNKEVQFGQQWKISFLGKDKDVNDILKCSIEGINIKPDDFVYNSSIGGWIAYWYPTEKDIGLKKITLKAKDLYATSTMAVEVNVVGPPLPDLTINASSQKIYKIMFVPIYKKLYFGGKWSTIKIGTITQKVFDHYIVNAEINNIGNIPTEKDIVFAVICELYSKTDGKKIGPYMVEYIKNIDNGKTKTIVFNIDKSLSKKVKIESTIVKVDVTNSIKESNENNNYDTP